ncbi:MAG: hypothetical protein IJX65_01265 [Alistipes sp.]|nr:hypothetical protein [Alistipes sp.]
MWRRIANIALVVTIWAAIAAYVVYSATLVRRHKQEQNIERLAVEIEDSTAAGQLITSQRVREMLLEQGIATINTNVGSVDKIAIKELICNEGFVDHVGIYTTYNGTLHIRISQRKPLFRLVTEGYNCYITADGYIFGAPDHAALHTPVVSGVYRPIFKPDFEGDMRVALAALMAEAEDSVRIVGRATAPVLERQEHWLSRRKAVRDSTITERGERRRLYRYIDGHLRDCKRELQAIAAQQSAIRQRAEVTRQRYNELRELIAFISTIESDRFWRSEIVQIVASTTSYGSLSLTLIPRSGDHRIEFGTLADSERKMTKLRAFYDKVMPTCGWDSYKSVNLNFADRIVCTYRTAN